MHNMKVIKCLVKSMYCELDTADKYYRNAIEYKDDQPTIAQTYIDIASQELQHCEKFHTAVVALISKQKSTGIEIPEAMKAIWEYEHTKIIEYYDELKYKISKFVI